MGSEQGGHAESWGELREQLAADVRRVADRLRHLSTAQLAAPPEPPHEAWAPEYESRAAAVRAASACLAEAAAGLEASLSAMAPGPAASVERFPAEQHRVDERRLPEVSSHALGDVVAVTGKDLLAAMEQVAPDTEVTLGDGARSSAGAAVEEAARRLADVRRRI